MKIIEEKKIGEKLTVGVHKEHGEIGIFIASEDVSASCAFRPQEWEKFVGVINEADRLLKENEAE
ncbi:hypothetical protein MWH28_11610 [Natroniella sulfidigena]|uniref:hypothetical protein n=1 Tax=Natroniella sulfidigena TaxID=723921 RepID=UPI00200B6491|nr:hypothetical protein [Natroniella sulfidigena]MCK8818003.1 hypothetical protein [Natroniella sulfidigena]